MSTQEKRLYMTVLMTPDMGNFSGQVQGGALLKLLDQVAYACAARYCKSHVVTASLDQVFFKEPIQVGELVTFKANVNYTGRTSMEVGIMVIAENLQTKEKRHTNSLFHHGRQRRAGQSKACPTLGAGVRGRATLVCRGENASRDAQGNHGAQ